MSYLILLGPIKSPVVPIINPTWQ